MGDFDMKKTKNDYLLFKAEREKIESEIKESEINYLVKNNIKNEDGSIPAELYLIDDVELAYFSIENFWKENSDLEIKYNEIVLKFNHAKKKLVSFGLNSIPIKLRTDLEKSIKEYKRLDGELVEKKVIDIALRLAVK
nr:hypothetical protein [Carnobacterium maltaromaticum]